MALQFIAATVPEARLFALDAQTMIQVGIILFNLVVLAFVMSRLLYKPVQKFMNNRANLIRDQLKRAEDELAKATELKLEYEQKIRDAKTERDHILETAQKLAAEKREEILAEARRDADKIKADSDAYIESEKLRVQDEIRAAILEVSSVMAEKFVSLSLDEDTHDRLFYETIAELERVPWRK